jgi:hypothetical protein
MFLFLSLYVSLFRHLFLSLVLSLTLSLILYLFPSWIFFCFYTFSCPRLAVIFMLILCIIAPVLVFHGPFFYNFRSLRLSFRIIISVDTGPDHSAVFFLSFYTVYFFLNLSFSVISCCSLESLFPLNVCVLSLLLRVERWTLVNHSK